MNRQHAPRVFDEQAAVDAYKAQYRALALRFGPFVDAVARSYAAGASVQWVRFKEAARLVQRAHEQRERGKGRKPAAAAVERLRRREGLAWQSYDMAVRRLEELAASQRPRSFAEAARRAAAASGAAS